jgi:hypothetical protein
VLIRVRGVSCVAAVVVQWAAATRAPRRPLGAIAPISGASALQSMLMLLTAPSDVATADPVRFGSRRYTWISGQSTYGDPVVRASCLVAVASKF